MPISRAATDRSGRRTGRFYVSKKLRSCGRAAASAAWAGWVARFDPDHRVGLLSRGRICFLKCGNVSRSLEEPDERQTCEQAIDTAANATHKSPSWCRHA